MIKSVVVVFFVMLMALSLTALGGGENSLLNIAVFTTQALPVSFDGYTQVSVCYLDDYQRLTDNINQKIKQQRLTTVQADALAKSKQPAIIQAYQCLLSAKKLGVTSLPAVVFNHQQVVIGTQQLSHAIASYDSWQEAQQ